MAAALTAYTVVAKVDRPACERAGMVLARYVTPSSEYVGLRQRPEDAVERARMISTSRGETVGRDTHIFLRTTFSAAGFARYALLSTDKAHKFVPMLYKKVYYNSARDWQVWHFQGDLPLAATDNDNAVLITSEWVEMDLQ